MLIDSDELKKQGERQTVEFKTSLASPKEAFQSLCAMINTDAAEGKVYFGVSPDGMAVGVDPGNLDTAQKSLAQGIRNNFAPSIIVSIQVLECQGKTLILLQATRAEEVAYHEYDCTGYIREGTTNRKLTYTEKQQLAKKRNPQTESRRLSILPSLTVFFKTRKPDDYNRLRVKNIGNGPASNVRVAPVPLDPTAYPGKTITFRLISEVEPGPENHQPLVAEYWSFGTGEEINRSRVLEDSRVIQHLNNAEYDLTVTFANLDGRQYTQVINMRAGNPSATSPKAL